MNYIEWKYKLNQKITYLEFSEQRTIISYYDELFQDKSDEGYTESEILKAFGDPEEVANELIGGLGTMENFKNQTEEQREERKKKFKENFEKFQDKFNKKTTELLSSLGKHIKKFGKFIMDKCNELEEYHKTKK